LLENWLPHVLYSSQFLETLSGLATIRAFGWQDELILLNNLRLDSSQKPFYLLYSIQRWLNLVLDLMVSGLAIVLVTVAVELRGSINGGFAGIALYNIMTLSDAMKAAVSVWTVLETSIGAVARVKTFEEETPREALPEESYTPPDDWPARGDIDLLNVGASYK
jgi:ATP-binding cassette, subfamily C (CFTR/MRP), member 1